MMNFSRQSLPLKSAPIKKRYGHKPTVNNCQLDHQDKGNGPISTASLSEDGKGKKASGNDQESKTLRSKTTGIAKKRKGSELINESGKKKEMDFDRKEERKRNTDRNQTKRRRLLHNRTGDKQRGGKNHLSARTRSSFEIKQRIIVPGHKQKVADYIQHIVGSRSLSKKKSCRKSASVTKQPDPMTNTKRTKIDCRTQSLMSMVGKKIEVKSDKCDGTTKWHSGIIQSCSGDGSEAILVYDEDGSNPVLLNLRDPPKWRPMETASDQVSCSNTTTIEKYQQGRTTDHQLLLPAPRPKVVVVSSDEDVRSMSTSTDIAKQATSSENTIRKEKTKKRLKTQKLEQLNRYSSTLSQLIRQEKKKQHHKQDLESKLVEKEARKEARAKHRKSREHIARRRQRLPPPIKRSTITVLADIDAKTDINLDEGKEPYSACKEIPRNGCPVIMEDEQELSNKENKEKMNTSNSDSSKSTHNTHTTEVSNEVHETERNSHSHTTSKNSNTITSEKSTLKTTTTNSVVDSTMVSTNDSNISVTNNSTNNIVSSSDKNNETSQLQKLNDMPLLSMETIRSDRFRRKKLSAVPLNYHRDEALRKHNTASYYGAIADTSRLLAGLGNQQQTPVLYDTGRGFNQNSIALSTIRSDRFRRKKLSAVPLNYHRDQALLKHNTTSYYGAVPDTSKLSSRLGYHQQTPVLHGTGQAFHQNSIAFSTTQNGRFRRKRLAAVPLNYHRDQAPLQSITSPFSTYDTSIQPSIGEEFRLNPIILNDRHAIGKGSKLDPITIYESDTSDAEDV